jgi:hypothetical protein
MKVKNGKIVEATEDELFGYWLKAEFCEIMSLGEFKKRCVELGTKVIEEE